MMNKCWCDHTEDVHIVTGTVPKQICTTCAETELVSSIWYSGYHNFYPPKDHDERETILEDKVYNIVQLAAQYQKVVKNNY